MYLKSDYLVVVNPIILKYLKIGFKKEMFLYTILYQSKFYKMDNKSIKNIRKI